MYDEITVLQCGWEAGALLLLNAPHSSGAPVGCARSDAQTQASHWLELEDSRPLRFHRCSDPLSLSPGGEKTTRTGGERKKEREKEALLCRDYGESEKLCRIGTGHFLEGGIISRRRRAGSVLHSGVRCYVFPMDFDTVEEPWELNYC